MREDEGYTSNLQRPKYQFYSNWNREAHKWRCNSWGYWHRNEEEVKVSWRIEKENDKAKWSLLEFVE